MSKVIININNATVKKNYNRSKYKDGNVKNNRSLMEKLWTT